MALQMYRKFLIQLFKELFFIEIKFSNIVMSHVNQIHRIELCCVSCLKVSCFLFCAVSCLAKIKGPLCLVGP
jgi:hypothetical protein